LLGGGYGGIAVAGRHVLTTIRRGESDLHLALDRTTGRTLWSQEVAAKEIDLQYGMGPFATPLVVEDRVVFLGGSGKLSCLQRSTGELLWSLDLRARFEPLEPDAGFASCPLLDQGRIFVFTGGRGASVSSLDVATGEVIWSKHNFKADYASPLLVHSPQGRELICQLEDEVVSLDPDDGRLLWRRPSRSDRTQHVITPLHLGENRLLTSTTYSAKAYELESDGPRLLWQSNQIRAQVGNLLHLPTKQMVLGASGASVGSPLTALDARDGSRLWKSRDMQAGFLWAVGNRVFCLTRDGRLAQGTASRNGLELIDSAQIFREREVWSAPAVSGGLLFLKSQREICALQLGESAAH
jgi:outer membrane protein assembly factor BamB